MEKTQKDEQSTNNAGSNSKENKNNEYEQPNLLVLIKNSLDYI